MARKVITTTTEEDEKEAADAPESDEDVIRALTEIEGSDEIRWQIHRISEPDKGYVTEMSTAELTISRIAELGPGRYRVRGIKSDGRYFKSSVITIAKPPQTQNPNQLLTELMEKNKGTDTLQLMSLLMNQQQAQQGNMTQVLIAALGKEQKTDIPWGAIVAAVPPSLVALKEFFANKADPMKQMMDAITLTEKLRGDGDKTGTSWPDLIKEGLGSIPATLQALKGGTASSASEPTPVAGVEVRSIPRADVPVMTPEAIAPPTDSQMNLQLLSWMRDMIAKLLKAAQRNGNVELYAELFIEELPESISDEQLLSMLESDDWWDRLLLLESRIGSYRDWFVELRDNIITVVRPDGDTDDRSERADRTEATDGKAQATDSGTIRETPESDDADAG